MGFGPADESSNLSRATNISRSLLEEKIVKALWDLRVLSSKSQSTYAKKIKYLSKHVNIENSFETEKYILSLNASKYKSTLLMAYMHFCRSNAIAWTPPILKTQSMPIAVPTEERIDKIIGRCSLKYIATFQISKHGLRPDEISKIVLRDIDLQRGLL